MARELGSHAVPAPTAAVRFTWDEAKRRQNVAKHKLDFRDAARISWQYAVLSEMQRVDGEEREIVFVPLHANIIVVAYTILPDDTYRLISMRRANKNELGEYYDQLS